MKVEQFRRERDYGAMHAIAIALLRRKLITHAEYRKVEAVLIRKYHPVTGSLQDKSVGNPPQKNRKEVKK